MTPPIIMNELEQALRAFADQPPRADDPQRPLELFVALFDAIRPRRRKGPTGAVRRYVDMVERLERDPAIAVAVREHLRALIESRRLARFLTESGILPGTGFFQEYWRILAQRLLPEVPDDSDMEGCLQRIFHRPDDWVWLNEVPPEVTLRFWRALTTEQGQDELVRLHVVEQMIEALLVLAYRVGAMGSEPELDRLGPRYARHVVRFQAAAAAAQRFADALRLCLAEGRPPNADAQELMVLIDQCDEALDDARRIARRSGTSLRLTHLLRRCHETLRRMEKLARLLSVGGHADVQGAVLGNWSELVREAVRMGNQRNSPGRHLAKGIGILALRVTDNAAKTGEHYIAETPRQYLGMWLSAAGAGSIIAILALLKVFAGGLSLAPAGYALLYSLNYGLGFALIYMLRMTIATKQPAMTAQTIAGYLGTATRGRVADLERVVDLIAAVARSQLAAILGNVLVALPTALLIAHVLSGAKGAPLLSQAKAATLLQDLDPLGWAIPHAALAGVFLFLSGLISGYFDNKASYANIGARVGGLRWLRRLLGEGRAVRVGIYVEDHLGGLMGNFLFGCMLGSAGTIGMILGLPLDIRHIAFAAANLGYALQAHDFLLPWRTVAWAALGVALIGLTNLAVSFALALWVALRARGIEFRQWRELLRLMGRRMLGQPASFLLPRARGEAEPDMRH
ncbi:MAG: site-specific recombinase [Thiobacillaceae bacterium]|jgi:site-specific recombinase|nr:site-specific recombinase [Thiobacillaceae bacterium]